MKKELSDKEFDALLSQFRTAVKQVSEDCLSPVQVYDYACLESGQGYHEFIDWTEHEITEAKKHIKNCLRCRFELMRQKCEIELHNQQLKEEIKKAGGPYEYLQKFVKSND